MNEKKPLLPRNGSVFQTLIVARISGGPRQKDVSLEDQDAHGRQVSEELYSGATEFHLVATRGKGERLDRSELEQIEKLLRTPVVPNSKVLLQKTHVSAPDGVSTNLRSLKHAFKEEP